MRYTTFKNREYTLSKEDPHFYRIRIEYRERQDWISIETRGGFGTISGYMPKKESDNFVRRLVGEDAIIRDYEITYEDM